MMVTKENLESLSRKGLREFLRKALRENQSLQDALLDGAEEIKTLGEVSKVVHLQEKRQVAPFTMGPAKPVP